MKKRLLSILLILCTSVSLLSGVSFASTGNYGDLTYTIYNDGTVSITDCNENAVEVTIPKEIENLPVTSILNYAFDNCTLLEKISFEGALPEMPYYAFSDCTNLKKLNISKLEHWLDGGDMENYYIFSGSLFDNDWELSINNQIVKNLVIPESVTNLDALFYNCKSIEQITFEGEIPRVYNKKTFQGCTNLKRIDVPSLEAWINYWHGEIFDDNLFANAWELYVDETLVEDLVIPESVMYFNSNKAFQNCKSIKSVTFHDNYAGYLPAEMFANCVNLSEIDLQDNIAELSKSTFYNTAYYNDEDNWKDGCLYLESCLIDIKENISGEFNIPYGTTVLAEGIFENSAVTKVSLPSTVTYMKMAFNKNTSIHSVEVQSGATYIGYRAFYGCTNLSDITLPNTINCVEKEAFINTAFYNDEANWENGILYLDQILIANKTEETGTFTVKAGTRVIGSEGLKNTRFSNFILPFSLQTINGSAFEGCTNLTDIEFPHKVRTFYNYAFKGCTALKTITFPDRIDNLSPFSFEDCTTLETIYNLTGDIGWMGGRIFVNCTSLKDIYFTGTRELWDKIYGSQDLGTDMTNVTIHCEGDNIPEGECGKNLTWELTDAGVLTISGTGKMYDFAENGAPWDADKEKIKEIVIKDGITKIGANSFPDYPNVSIVRIPPSVTAMGQKAFGYETGNIKSVYITDLAKWCEIEFPHGNANPLASSKLYLNNQLVENLTIPDETSAIGSYSFQGCVSIKEATIHKNITTPYRLWLYGCNNLENINVSEENPVYCSVDGNLFSKDKTVIYQYLRGKNDAQYILPATVKRINQQAFDGCRKLRSVVLSDGLTHIDQYAFWNCSGLTSIKIPNTVTTIDVGAFGGRVSLTDVYYYGTEAEWNQITIAEMNDPLLNAKIHFNYDPSAIRVGDISGDENVDISDAVMLFQHSMLPDLYPIEYAGSVDFNKDGVVDISDAVLLFQHSMLPDLYPIE